MNNFDNSKTCFKQVKDSILKIKGMTVSIRSVRGRRRFVIKNCVISGVYDNLFTVSVAGDSQPSANLSFAYDDVLTGTIAITVYKRNNDEKVS